MESKREIFKYNTKNAGQQIINLTNQYYDNLNEISKTEIIETMRSIGIHLIKQYEEHENEF